MGVNSSLPVALSRLLGHDVVLTSFSALAAEEWTPPGVGDRGSCGGGGSNSAPVSDRGVTSADVSLDEIEDCSSSSDAGCENVRPFSTVSALRHVSASTDTPFASNTTPWLSCGDGASSARGKRLSCLHQIFWHSACTCQAARSLSIVVTVHGCIVLDDAVIEDAHMALSSRSKTSRCVWQTGPCRTLTVTSGVARAAVASRALASLRVEGEQWWVVPEASARKTKGVVAAVRQLHSSRTGASPDAGCFWM